MPAEYRNYEPKWGRLCQKIPECEETIEDMDRNHELTYYSSFFLRNGLLHLPLCVICNETCSTHSTVSHNAVRSTWPSILRVSSELEAISATICISSSLTYYLKRPSNGNTPLTPLILFHNLFLEKCCTKFMYIYIYIYTYMFCFFSNVLNIFIGWKKTNIQKNACTYLLHRSILVLCII